MSEFGQKSLKQKIHKRAGEEGQIRWLLRERALLFLLFFACRAVPLLIVFRLGGRGESDAFKVEPLEFTCLVVTADHGSVRYALTIAVDGLVRIDGNIV